MRKIVTHKPTDTNKYLVKLSNNVEVWVTADRARWLQRRGRILYLKEVSK